MRVSSHWGSFTVTSENCPRDAHMKDSHTVTSEGCPRGARHNRKGGRKFKKNQTTDSVLVDKMFSNLNILPQLKFLINLIWKEDISV